MLVSPSQQMTTSPSASSTSSGGTNNSLTSSGQSQPQQYNGQQINFMIVISDVSTIPQSTSSGSEDQSSSVNILSWFYFSFDFI